VLLALAASSCQAADEVDGHLPLWELGLGAAALQLPDYRGSDVSHHYLLPLPYLIYRGRWLRADREGARAVLIDSPQAELNLSLTASAPARSRDNPTRAGMADLPATIELGPKLDLHLWRAADGPAQLDLQLPLRAAISLTREPQIIGEVFTPTLSLDLPRLAGGWNLGLQTGLNYGSQRYHAHYYGVAAMDATATRPAYDARAGYGGWQTLAALSQRFERSWVGFFVRYDRLDGAVFADSPLVRQRQALSVGVAMAWVLARSTQDARSHDD
jgi:outer membrane scaffolding protein for murein synthesis (MipA/OmpV family)